MLWCPNWAVLKTKYPVVANMVAKMLNRCFGLAFPESHVGAEPELVRRNHQLGGDQRYSGRKLWRPGIEKLHKAWKESTSILELRRRSDLQDVVERLDIGVRVEKDSKVSSLRNQVGDSAI